MKVSFFELASHSSKLALWAIGMLSAIVNLLALTGSLYMMQIYDRVMASHSIPTLISLSLIAIWLYLIQAILEQIRTRILIRISTVFDEKYSEKALALVYNLPRGNTGEKSEDISPIRDLDTIRTFLASAGTLAIFDLPWVPIFLIFIFLLHPDLGILAIGGAIILCLLAWFNDKKASSYNKIINNYSGQRHNQIEAIKRNYEVIIAMGMNEAIASNWKNLNKNFLKKNIHLSDLMGGLNSFAKTFRYILQSAVLGLGAYLVIKQEFSAGSMIGASIIMSRALAPIEQAIAHWKSFIATKQSSHRLDSLLNTFNEDYERTQLEAPVSELLIENTIVVPPQSRKAVVNNVSFKLIAGNALAIMGPSAAGKTTLVRAIVGAWPVTRGNIRLDGADLTQWSSRSLGQHIGYLPQNVQLFDGTIAQNIARFEKNPDPNHIIAAAKQAGVHEMILNLPNGYDTLISETGGILSSGQRQRIALARALFRDPFLVVLDEPNSNLDSDGDVALVKAINHIRSRNGIVIIIAHRPNILTSVDLLAVMANGQIQNIGPRDEILKLIIKNRNQTQNSNQPESNQDGTQLVNKITEFSNV